ncbi:NYN domain protein, partial [Vibrio parahaemolyticus EKP-028]
SKQRFHC